MIRRVYRGSVASLAFVICWAIGALVIVPISVLLVASLLIVTWPFHRSFLRAWDWVWDSVDMRGFINIYHPKLMWEALGSLWERA